MIDPNETEEEAEAENKKKNGEGESEGTSGQGKSGSGGVAPSTETEGDEEPSKKRKIKDEGEGDADSWGRGKAGAGAGVSKVKRLSPDVLKKVMDNWRHLDVAAVVEAVAEFFMDLPMRASANLSVVFDKTKSFAIINKLIAFGEQAAEELSLSRQPGTAGKGTRGFQNKRAAKTSPGINMGPHPSGG
ncbi:MAG: hypothetical protein PHW76_06290 [Alphaproteobacteria bacterium]|nr:hypothetical protein [Alphaproteobacteria bacterium]